MAPAPCPAPGGGLRCGAVLLLAVCLSITALPHGLGSLVAPSLGHLSQRGHRDPRSHPTVEPPASEGTLREENSSRGMGAAGLALGTPTGAVMLGDSSVTRSRGFLDVQDGAPGGQERAVSSVPCHPVGDVGEDPAAAHLQPPAGPSPALPSEGTSSALLSVPAVTPVGLWSLGTASASPSATSRGVSPPQVLVPLEGFGGPAVPSEEQIDPSPLPTPPALPPPSKAPPVPTWTWIPSSSGPAEAGVSSAAPGAPEAPHEDGAATGASWPPEPTLSSSPLVPRHPPSTTSSPSSSHPPASPAPSSQTPAVTPDAPPASSPSVTSWHPSDVPTATGWVAAGGTLPAAAASRSAPGSVQPPVRSLPLSFRLLGITYTEALSRRASGSYRQLEDEVRLMVSASRAPRGGVFGYAGWGAPAHHIPACFSSSWARHCPPTRPSSKPTSSSSGGCRVSVWGCPRGSRAPRACCWPPVVGQPQRLLSCPPGTARCWCTGRFCSGGMPPAAPTSSARCSRRRAEQGMPSAGGWSPAPSGLEVSQEGLQQGSHPQTSPCALIRAQTSSV